jgi:DNA-binding NarL/FixJ family response regulator
MQSDRHTVIALGWSRLLFEILAAALADHGWNVVRWDVRGSVNRDFQDTDPFLLYCSRPEQTSADILRTRAQFSEARVAVLGHGVSDSDLLRLIEAGMSVYIDLQQSVPDLLDALHMVKSKRSLSHGRVTQLVLKNISRLSRLGGTHVVMQLTAREKEIHYLVSTGLGNKQIADFLSISPNTVKNHIHNLLQKLNVKNRHEAASVMPSPSPSGFNAAPKPR